MRESIRLPSSRGIPKPKLIQRFRYIQFLGKFHRYLSTPKQIGVGKFEERLWRLPRYTETEKLRKELEVWAKKGYFPKDLVEHHRSAIKRYNIHLLAWVVRKALIYYIVGWVAFLPRKLFKYVTYHTFGGKRG